MLSSNALMRLTVRRLAAAPVVNVPAGRPFSVSASKAGGHISINETAEGREYTHPKIGDREIVGWGCHGHHCYVDRTDFPYPAIRWKGPSAPGVAELRKKELGDWKELSLEDKKALYRASFRQTFSEYHRNEDGSWKYMVGGTLLGLSFSLFMWYFCKLYVYNPVPESMTLEGRLRTLRYEIAIRKDPIDGLASRWDYDKDQWKEEEPRKKWFFFKKGD